MHGLLLLVATGTSGGGEAPKYAGYDARSRQLLQDMARALGVPWHTFLGAARGLGLGEAWP